VFALPHHTVPKAQVTGELNDFGVTVTGRFSGPKRLETCSKMAKISIRQLPDSHFLVIAEK
jgi:putative cell wall-binding protein